MAHKAVPDWQNRIGRRVTLRDLHILSAAVRWGSMAKAASHLAVSQSVVSEAIANLELALRVRLLDRSPRGIEPTIYADALLKRGHVVFDELQQGIKDIEFLSDPAVGEVRIAAPEFLTAWLLPAAIERLSRRYPRVGVRLIEPDMTTMDFRELRERSVDLVVTRTPKNFRDDDLDIEVLLDDPHHVVAGRKSRLARCRKITLADLAKEPWIIPPNPVINAMLRELFEPEGLEVPTDTVSTTSILLQVHLVATGRFLSVLPDSVLRSVAKQLPFKVLPIDFGTRSPPIVIVRLKNRTLTPVVEIFIEELRKVASLA